MIGVNPDGFTLRQLAWMFDEREKHRWDAVSQLIAVLININGGDCTAGEINPYRQRERVVLSERESLEMLRRVFVDNNGKDK